MPRVGRIAGSLLAGGLAIAINTLLLASADIVPLATAHGGLLRLLSEVTGLIAPASVRFSLAFHVAAGLAMALLYGLVLDRLLPGPPWLRGMLYAAIVWFANALIVLPAIGEGFAGARTLSLAGMLWFAVAHTSFFLLLAVLYGRLGQDRR